MVQPHQQRVIDEQTELQVKMKALDHFINESEVFKSLEEIDKILLKQQFRAMIDYDHILGLRINRFK